MSQIVVKVDVAGGHTINEVGAVFPIAVDNAVLASRGIYLVHSNDPKFKNDPKKTDDLAKKMAHYPGVDYAEPDSEIRVGDTQFHGWPYGLPGNEGTDADVFTDQPVAIRLDLDAVHRRSRGDGVVVAVLDTGADPDQPVLSGRLRPGWNYVEDNADTSEVGDATDQGDDPGNGAVGHGTFVSGLIALAAPGARILPQRVLDGDGTGNVFVVAQAILDAVDEGAEVINMSFGTAKKIRSKLLEDAIHEARQKGVVVVSAAGNEGNSRAQFPAAQPSVLSVAALDSDGALAGFSNWGPWVQVAAPGDNLVGPVPNGGYATWAGTSMAAPLVSAQVAIVRSAAPGLKADKVMEAVERTATKLAERDDVRFGAIDIPASLDFALKQH